MSLLALELSDAGILAAAGNPAKLLELDGEAIESPGFALPQKKGLLVGKAAESKAHLFPREVLDRFWDQLNIEPLEQPGQYTPQNHAEIVYSHLAAIWQQIQQHGDEIVIAVPSFYDRKQLGLILGITNELSIPVKGFIPLALAASSLEYPDKMLLYLDIHHHRIEVNYLKQGEFLIVEDSLTLVDKGLIQLYREWVDTIAKEFVRSTRFDPYHQAASEQELYDRLPNVLSDLQHNPSIVFEISGENTTYSITLKRDLIIRETESLYKEFRRLIAKIRSKYGKDESPIAVQLSHRITRLPGCKEMLATIKNAQIIELDRGAGTRGLLGIWNQLSDHSNSEGISFFTSRPWELLHRSSKHGPSAEAAAKTLPTHLLYRSIAYPITEKPLIIGREIDPENNGIQIYGPTTGISRKHCSIELRGREIVLVDHSDSGTYVNDTRVNGSTGLKLGQTIRVGTPGIQLELIACLKSDET